MRLGMTPPAVLKLSSASTAKKGFQWQSCRPDRTPRGGVDLGFLVGGEFQDHGPRCRWGTGLPDYHVSCRQSAVSRTLRQIGLGPQSLAPHGPSLLDRLAAGWHAAPPPTMANDGVLPGPDFGPARLNKD